MAVLANTHTHTLSLSLSLTHTHSLSPPGCPENESISKVTILTRERMISNTILPVLHKLRQQERIFYDAKMEQKMKWSKK